MKKLLNEPESFVDDVLAGIVAAHPDHLRPATTDGRVLVATGIVPGQVGIVTGGGSGHLPLFLGYVGPGLATAVAVGNVFSAQSSDAALAAIEAADSGAGVLVLIGNYTGDRLNFELAKDLAEAQGRKVEMVLVGDDVASAPPDRAADRRGVAGIVFAYKCAGAAAADGASLADVASVARRVATVTATIGVGLSPTTLPTTGRPSFTIGDDEMELGIGIHGEPGIRRTRLEPADAVADDLCERLLAELRPASGTRVAVLVNGLGGTSHEELYIITGRVHQVLGRRGIAVHRTYVGEYATSMEMAGLSVSMLPVDEEIARLLQAPAHSPFVPAGLA